MIPNRYEEMGELNEKIAEERKRVSEESRELKRKDPNDPALQTARQYLDMMEDTQREVAGAMENLVLWTKLKLTESRIHYERGKKGLKRGELYQP